MCRAVGAAWRKMGAHVQRLEDMYSVGIPDMLVTYKGKTVLVEFKYSKNEVVRSRKIGLRTGQVVWLHKLVAAGGEGYVLYRAGKTTRLFSADNVVELSDSVPLYRLNSLALVTTTNRTCTEVLEYIGGNDV